MISPRPHSPVRFIHIARRHALLIVISAIVVTVASAIAIKQLPDLYESSASVTIDMPTGETVQIEPSRRLAALRQQITNRARLEELISKHDLYRDLKSSGVSQDEIVNRFRSDIRLEADSKDVGPAYSFTISYRAEDGATAQKLTVELAELLAADSAKPSGPQSSDETAMLRQRATELAAQLREQETARPWLLNLKEEAFVGSAFAGPAVAPSRTPTVSADTSRAQQFLVEGYRDKQYALQQQMADIEQRLVEQRRIVEQQKKGGTLGNNPSYAILLAKRAELQGQRDNLVNRQELTEKHPRVLLVTDQLAAIDRQLADIRQQDAGTTSQSPEARELRSLESERNRIKVELEVTNRAIARQAANSQPTSRPAQPVTTDTGQREGVYGRLAQEYFAIKRAHKEAVAALERADAKRQPGDSKPEQLRVLEQASLPNSPSHPNRGLLHLIALAAGLAVGACFAAVAESRRSRSLHGCADVERYTNLPMLVAIPKTVTDEERKRDLRRARLRLAVGAAAAAVAVFALTKLLIVSNLFALIGEK
jgi:capsular polysaccharide biosynthesis protein